MDMSPTVIPEQKAPTHVKTTIYMHEYVRQWINLSKIIFMCSGGIESVSRVRVRGVGFRVGWGLKGLTG